MHWLNIYHVAHYCRTCHKEYDHSQGDWNEYLRKCYNDNHEIYSCETKRLSRDDKKRLIQWRIISHRGGKEQNGQSCKN